MIKLNVKRLSVIITLLVIFTLLLAACGGGDDTVAEPEPAAPAEEPAAPAEEPAEEEATEAEEEAAAEPEAEATAEPEEEGAAESEEEATEPEEEATAEPEEEATEPEEEATAEPEEEATAEPEEEATAEPEEEGAAESEDTAMVGDPEAGAYIRTMAGGCGCHFNRDLGTLAGGNGFIDDTVFSRNLTPHETGIANLSDEALADLIRFGSHDGYTLVVMPRFSTMADEDVTNLIAYLRSQEPVENEVPERNLDFEPEAQEFPAPPAEAPAEGAARGAYVASIARCGMCHTPVDDDGAPLEGMMLAGAPYQDTVAPNLTPHEETGLGEWSEEEIVEFLSTGVYANGTEAHSGMAGVVENITSQLTEEDRQALAAFLKSLPPVENTPSAE